MTENLHSTRRVYMSMELSNKNWKLRFSNLQKEREINVPSGDVEGFLRQIERAKEKLDLTPEAEVYSCYEAGRDGFWISRMLEKYGIENLVVDPASIEVKRRKRRCKTDRIDAKKLLAMLIRHWEYGERGMWQIVRVPKRPQEDERRVHRQRERLKNERGAHINRIRALLVLHGIRVGSVLKMGVEDLRDWEGNELPEQLQLELKDEQERLEVAVRQMKELEQYQYRRMKNPETKADRYAAEMMRLKSVGPQTAWVLSKEIFGWRQIRNRRQLGALAGLTGTPYNSGDGIRDQGISKAGNRLARTACIELSWLWLRYQPDSELTQWFRERFAHGSRRMRRIGIVALARKLLVALWKYVEFGEVPAGAVLSA